MKLLEGKTALVFGIANERSIAWGIAQQLYRHGARLALSYAHESLERRVMPLARQIECDFTRQCDVTKDEEISDLFDQAESELGGIDILVHAIAYARREDLGGSFSRTSRDGFHVAMDVSVYSLVAITREALRMMPQGGSVLTVTYYGGEKVVPSYGVMGVAKAALESTTRYLASELGTHGIRVNAVSPGPVRTLSAAGVRGFKDMYRQYPEITPLRNHIGIDDIGDAAVWLASDMARATTGQILYVDGGYNILGSGLPQAFEEA